MSLPRNTHAAFDRARVAVAQAHSEPSPQTLTAAVLAWLRALEQPELEAFPEFLCEAYLELGNSHLDRFDFVGEPSDLDNAILGFEAALRIGGRKLPYWASLQGSLGGALLQRYHLRERLEDLHEAITAYRKALTGTGTTGVRRERILNNLGLALYRQYMATGNLADLNAAIKHLQELEGGEDHDNAAAAKSNLGIALRALFRETKEHAHLEASITAQRAALQSIPPSSPNWGRWQSNLGNALLDRFDLVGQESDLEAAIAAHRAAIAAIPPGSADRTSAPLNLGTALARRFDRLGNYDDLDAAIAAFEEGIAVSPTGSSAWTSGLTGLSNALRWRFFARGDLNDLHAAVEMSDRVLSMQPHGSPAWINARTGVGIMRRSRFAAFGERVDLEQALSAFSEVIDAAHEGSVDWARGQFGRGETFNTRYKVTGQFSDLDAAIEAYRKAISAFPSGSGDSADASASLAEALDLAYLANDQIEDVYEAIDLYRQALLVVRPGSLKWTRWQTGLAVALRLRCRALNRDEDLEAAIKAVKAAIAASQDRGVDWVVAHLELGEMLLERYSSSRAGGDLDQVIILTQRIQKHVEPKSSEWTWWQKTRGDAYRFRFDATGSTSDAEASIAAYQQILDSVEAEQWPDRVISAACGIAELHSDSGAWLEAAVGWRRAITASSEVYKRQLLAIGREAWLTAFADIYIRAAYAYARAGDVREAVVTIERGRARAVSASLERDRAELEHLKSRDSEAYALYAAAAARLRRIEALERTGVGEAALATRLVSSGAIFRQEMADAQASFEEAVARIRSVPGYSSFLTDTTWEHFVVWLRDIGSPLVYLIPTRWGGLALVVQPSAGQPGRGEASIESLWLPQLSGANVRDLMSGSAATRDQGWAAAYAAWSQNPADDSLRQTWFAVLELTTRRLWDLAMKELVHALQRAKSAQAVLVPSGLLGLLPLHAAWVEDSTAATGRHYALDEVAFSYAPSARLAAGSRRTAATAAAERLLAVDEPWPVTKAGRLPNSAAEVAAIASLFVDPQVLPHERATRPAILEGLASAQVVHFSCHGVANWVEPLRSGLLLAKDELLTVSDLLDLNLDKSRLATLSACETGGIGVRLPDEVVGLPAALLQAGFGGVVASLWSVSDASTAMLMERFYRLWQDEGLAPALALREAERWLRDTSNREKAEYFGRDIPAISSMKIPEAVAADFFSEVMTRPSESRSFAHPFWWAAFYLSGS